MNLNDLFTDFNQVVMDFKNDVLAFIPKLLLALLVLVIGYLLGRLIRFLIIRLVKYFNKMVSKWFTISLSLINLERTARFVGGLVFWVIILSALILVSDILGLTLVTDWMESILQYSPNLFASIFIVLIAMFIGRILAETITSVSKRMGLNYGKTLGKIARYLILITAIIIAIDQVGIEVSFLINLIDIVLAALLFGAALAFGLGAKTVVSNILATFYIRKMYRVGDSIKIGNIQGKIIRIDTTAVLIDAEMGQVMVPAKQFNESKSYLLTED
jgi:small-conductance mechanosensitive channel